MAKYAFDDAAFILSLFFEMHENKTTAASAEMQIIGGCRGDFGSRNRTRNN